MKINITSNDIFNNKGEIILPKNVMEYFYVSAPQAFRAINRVANNHDLWNNNGSVEGEIMLIIPTDKYSTLEEFMANTKDIPAPVAINVSFETFPPKKDKEPEEKPEEMKPVKPHIKHHDAADIWDKIRAQYVKRTGSELKLSDSLQNRINDIIDRLNSKNSDKHIEKVKDVITEVVDNDDDIIIVPLAESNGDYKILREKLVYTLLHTLNCQLGKLVNNGIKIPSTETFTAAFDEASKSGSRWKNNYRWISKKVFDFVKDNFGNIVDREVLVKSLAQELIDIYRNLRYSIGHDAKVKHFNGNTVVWNKIARIFIAIACKETVLEWKGLVMTRTGFNRIARVMIDMKAMKEAEMFGVKNTIGITFPRRWDF